MGVGFGHQGVDVDTAVDQPSGNGLYGAVRLLVVTDDVGHIGDAGQNAGAVGVAQTALDAQAVGLTGVKVCIVGQILATQQLDLLRLQGRYVGIIHRFTPPLCGHAGVHAGNALYHVKVPLNIIL